MSDLICLIPNHGYADELAVFVSWLNGIFFVHDPDQNSFKLEESVDGVVVQFTGTITDGFVREDAETASSTITGLDHLEGETVAVTSGGKLIGSFVVSNGQISMSSSLTTFQVGKTYTSTLTPMDLDIEGTGLATTKRINRIIVNVIDTVGGEIGPDVNNMKTIVSGTDTFTGLVEIPIPGGYSRDTDITVTQKTPLPMTVLSLTYDIGASRD